MRPSWIWRTVALGIALAPQPVAARPMAAQDPAPSSPLPPTAVAPVVPVASTQSWATSQAAELPRQGKEHAARGEGATATRRYLDAIGFDATYGPAYLALGALHEQAGDPREAERAYTM